MLGGWLAIAYWQQLCNAPAAERSVELVAPICNVLAYLTGPVALALPPWIAVAATVTAVLLLTAREKLHALAKRVEMGEIVTAAKFLISHRYRVAAIAERAGDGANRDHALQGTGSALLAVCTLSYASYLLLRFLAPADSDLAVALLGGLYSSTATTVVPGACRARRSQEAARWRKPASMLATAVMYLRILAIIAIFDGGLAQSLAPVMGALFIIGAALAAPAQYRRARSRPTTVVSETPHNPLELTAAALFTLLFIAILDRDRNGRAGISVPPVSMRSRRSSASPTSIHSSSASRKAAPARCRYPPPRRRSSSPSPRTTCCEGELRRRFCWMARKFQRGVGAGRARHCGRCAAVFI